MTMWDRFNHPMLPICPHPNDPHKYARGSCYVCHHNPAYGRCLNCGKTLDELWTIMSVSEGVGTVPRLSDVMSGVETTWGDQIDKGSIAGTPFWIHNVKESDYVNDNNEDVHILVLDITLNGPSRRDPHAVITVGNSPERQPMLAYFNSPDSARQPIGPVHCFEIPLKNKRSFWRIEDYDEEILNSLVEHGRYDANGQKVLPGA